MSKKLTFNERLRRNLKEKGSRVAKKWNEQLNKARNSQLNKDDK